MKRRITSAEAVAFAARSVVGLEPLELRRLLSGYTLVATLTDTADGGGYENFGSSIATQGNLALIGSPGTTATITNDGGQSFQEIDTTAGQVTLMDTSTGTILHTFHNPIVNPPTGSRFGALVAFVDGKIAIDAPGSNAVYIYNDTADDIPDQVYTDADPQAGFGTSMAVDGDDLLVSALQEDLTGNNGAILRFDLDSPSDTAAATYFNPDPGVTDNDQFGSTIASDGTYIYAKANVNGASEVVVMDNSGALVTVYHGLSGDFQYGFALATADHPIAGKTVIISDPANSKADQVDTSGNVLQTFNVPQEDQEFGAPLLYMAVNDGKLIGGNPTKTTLGEDTFLHTTGAAYVFDIASGALDATIENPNQDDTLNSDLADNYDYFGLLVAALPDGNFAISAPFANNANGIDAGTVYAYVPQVTPTNQAPTADAGAAQGISEGQTATLDASGSTDPDGPADISSYSWDLNNDGIYGDATGVTTAFTPDLPGSYTIGLKVTDSVGHESTDTTSVNVTDVAPTASAGANRTAITGQVLNFAGSATTAPGDAIVSYQWDFNYSGNPATFNAQASGANTSHSYAAIGSYTVALRVTDDDGQKAISTLTVTVANTVPVAGAINGPSIGVRQQSLGFAGSFTDPDANDPHEVSWNFGDGAVIAFHSTADTGALTASHTYLNSGTYSVVMTIRDSHGAVSNSQLSVGISTTALIAGTLYVGGTTANDKVTITKATNGANVGVNGPNTFYSVTGKIIIFGGDGADSLQSNTDFPLALEIYGGAGNDTLRGGLGNDIFVGGNGNDRITGDDGRDLLFGGTGADALTSNNGDDILIAGKTTFDDDLTSLRAILAEWASGRTVAERMNNLRNGTGAAARSNGNVFLQTDVTVFDDATLDTLTSGKGNDWLFANVDLGIKDKTDANATDVIDDVDVVVA